MDHAVLRISWEDLMSLLAMESRDLDCRCASWRPTCTPYTSERITPRLIYKNELKDLYSDSSYIHASRSAGSLSRATRRVFFFVHLQAANALWTLATETANSY
jgi:hypothetical protein